MRIIGGAWRGRALVAPPVKSLEIRPTSDRIRENLFNILSAKLAGGFAGLQVADLCAGTGAFGFEALSRGAAHVNFVDTSRTACALIRASASKLECAAQITISQCDATRLPRPPQPCDLIFLDPPYEQGAELAILHSANASNWCAPACVVIIEAPRGRALNVSLEIAELIDQRDYGKTTLHFLRIAAHGQPVS